jgi:hypothetical protein
MNADWGFRIAEKKFPQSEIRIPHWDVPQSAIRNPQ